VVEPPPSFSCPRCGAPRIEAPECPRCGVIYARAKPLVTAKPPVIDTPTVASISSTAESEAEFTPASIEKIDRELELDIRIWAIPVTLVLAKMAMAIDFLHSLSRIFLSMWVHELGHAVTAWFCGFMAFPGPWVTPVFETRNLFVTMVLAGVLLWIAFRGFTLRRPWLVVGAVILLGLQVKGTFATDPTTARMLIIFGGDGGMLVLGTLLMMTMCIDADSQIHRGWLRWGFLVIGAVAFMDALDTWWTALKDPSTIPLGEIEGIAHSDPSVLLDEYRWNPYELTHRYLRLAGACGVALGVAYVYGWREARARVAEMEKAKRKSG
jgi:hypothetical protein